MRLFREVKSRDALVLRFFQATSKAQLMNMALDAARAQAQADPSVGVIRALENARWEANTQGVSR